jgi:hypothetical protein
MKTINCILLASFSKSDMSPAASTPTIGARPNTLNLESFLIRYNSAAIIKRMITRPSATIFGIKRGNPRNCITPIEKQLMKIIPTARPVAFDKTIIVPF